ncbi:MAG: IS3 family transposase [Pseudohongiella sp.]|nr:IS3 family transposase [Pseudohongiella sp.]
MKYALIDEHVSQFSVRLMCRVLGVSRAGYYRWLVRPQSLRQSRRQTMKEKVADTWSSFKARYGAPRITEELNALKIPCSVNYVAELLRVQGLKAHNGKRFNYGGHPLTMNNVSDNLLWRDFKADKPNQKWTTDITYIWVDKQWMYLATVMDLFSRTIVGWALDKQMTEQLVISAAKMAFDRRGINEGLIIHSDRGVQYRSQKYIDFLKRHGAKQSMSRKGNCWDNAPMESFFSRLKVELIYAEKFETIQQIKSAVFEYIEVFYNRLRRHSALGYISPAEFERNAAKAA